jgi:hypothetical protein
MKTLAFTIMGKTSRMKNLMNDSVSKTELSFERSAVRRIRIKANGVWSLRYGAFENGDGSILNGKVLQVWAFRNAFGFV